MEKTLDEMTRDELKDYARKRGYKLYTTVPEKMREIIRQRDYSWEHHGDAFREPKERSVNVADNRYKTRYVICTRDHADNRLCYETGTMTFHGSIYMGDVLEAKRFDSLDEVCQYIAKNRGRFDLGFSVIGIPDVTFQKLQESRDGDRDLYRKYHDPNYAIR